MVPWRWKFDSLGPGPAPAESLGPPSATAFTRLPVGPRANVTVLALLGPLEFPDVFDQSDAQWLWPPAQCSLHRVMCRLPHVYLTTQGPQS